jgi:hypothetical protein
MRHRPWLLALPLALALQSAPALAAARLVTPTGGRATSSFPLLRWSLPKGEETEVVYIARRPTRAPTGEFVTANLEDTGPLSGRTQRYRSVNGLYSGRHYWLVATRDPDFNQHVSRVGRFRVVETLSVARLRTAPGAVPRRLDVRMRVRTNAPILSFTIRVVQGGRVVQVVTRRARVAKPGTGGTRTVHWLASSAVARGAPATLRVTVVAGSRSYRARLAITAP